MTSPSPAFKNSEGFTLMELLMVIVVMSVLSVMSISALNTTIDESRFQDTTAEMKAIRDAMLGDPAMKEGGVRSSFGYLGDLGAIPTAAQGVGALTTNPGHPVWALDQTVRFGRGWNGPYLTSAQAGVDFTRDAWGNLYVYNPAASPPSLTSYGADGAAGGTVFNSDITVELPVSMQRATVHGFISNAGGPYSGTATVELNSLNGSGALTTTTQNLTAANQGYFTFANIPLGKRSLNVYIPSKAAATTTFGPILLTVDSSNYLVPAGAIDVNPTGGGGGGGPAPTPTPPPCNAGAITLQAGSASTGGTGQRLVTFKVNIASTVQVSQIKATVPNTATWNRFRGDGHTADCAGTTTLTPCPVPSATSATLSSTLQLLSGAGKTLDFLFSANMIGASPTTVEFQHNLGCDSLTLTGF